MYRWPILFIVIINYVLMLTLFLWVSNIGRLNTLLLTIPFLLMTIVYVINFVNYHKDK
jgi:hypothetical protein